MLGNGGAISALTNPSVRPLTSELVWLAGRGPQKNCEEKFRTTNNGGWVGAQQLGEADNSVLRVCLGEECCAGCTLVLIHIWAFILRFGF